MTVALALVLVGSRLTDMRRAAITMGAVIAFATALPFALVGGALGPWPLDARLFYAPILFSFAGGPALIVVAIALAALGFVRDRIPDDGGGG